MYALTDEGREALHIIESTTKESNRNDDRGLAKAYSRWTVVLAMLMVGIIVLGSVAAYQQSQIAALSSILTSRSSELQHPSTVGFSFFKRLTVPTGCNFSSTCRPAINFTLNRGGNLTISDNTLGSIYMEIDKQSPVTGTWGEITHCPSSPGCSYLLSVGPGRYWIWFVNKGNASDVTVVIAFVPQVALSPSPLMNARSIVA
jgi:hypothetical protein